jgi:polygalacturonase
VRLGCIKENIVERDAPNRREFVVKPTIGIPALGALVALSGGASAPADKSHNVRAHGAVGDGKAKDTRSIQAAIDACHAAGGGTVDFPAGTYLSGSLHLKSDVQLHLGHGAVLRASEEPADFDAYEKLGFKNAADRETSFFHQSLIWAEDVERVAITGTGTIDCNRKRRGGPKAIALKRCKFVTISGLTIRDCPNYCISLLGTDYVGIDGVTILNGFADGIDPDCCHHVRIANCHIESWDDAIVPKTSFSLGQLRSTENLVVTNCVLATNCNAFKLGTESGGDFRNIAVSNCVFFSRSEGRPPISGISLLTVDGATIEGVTIDNISMTDVRSPIFLRLGNRGRDMATPTAGALRDVVISNVVARNARWPVAVVGVPGSAVDGVSISNMRIAYKGGGTAEEAKADVPEQPAKYPSADMFATYPASGLYARHARDLRLSSVAIRYESPDQRPALLCEDVQRLAIDGLEAATCGNALFAFRDVRGAIVRGCAPPENTKVFLEVAGRASDAISLLANDFSGVAKVVSAIGGARPEGVVEAGNRR